MIREVFADEKQERTVVVIPSLSFDPVELEKISGVLHYEERLLCLLMLLRLPRTRVVYVTSQPVDPAIVDYYLHLLPFVPTGHAMKRLTLISCDDRRLIPLTQKILERPFVLRRIRSAIASSETSHVTCFNATPFERTLAVRLGIPMYACDPDLTVLGNKSNGRELLREAGVPVADGFEHLSDADDLVDGLARLKQRNRGLKRAVLKLNEGFSGEGNALFSFDGAPTSDVGSWIKDELPVRLSFEAVGENWEQYREKLARMSGVVEEFIDGDQKRSPSVQMRIDPLGQIELVSTHDQIMGGPGGQIFLGCSFPADPEYRREIQAMGTQIAEVLRDRGVIGRIAVDFVSVRRHDQWQHHAIEINLRKGGTTLPFLMLQFLTEGEYDPDTGVYRTPTGQSRFYYASDNLQKESYVGLTPETMLDVAVYRDLHWNAPTQQGIVFHLLGAVTEYGKFGMVSVASHPLAARSQFHATVKAIDDELEAR